MAKRKTWYNNLYTLIRAPTAGSAASLLSCLRSLTLLLSCLMSTLLSYSRSFTSSLSCFVHALLSHLMPALLSHLVPALSSCLIPVLSYLVRILATRSPFPASVSYSEMPIALSSCLLLSQALTYLISLAFKIFKQALSDEFLHDHLTSSAESLYPFLTFGLLPKKIKSKRPFDSTFINSCPLTGNHTTKEVDLSFVLYRCLSPIKRNRLY